MIRLYLLGRTGCEGGDGASVDSLLRAPKRLALVSFLAVEEFPGFHRRDTLLGLLWPDLDASRASGALRQTLNRLRTDLGDAIVTRGQGEVGLDPDALWCDVAAFTRQLGQGRLRGPLGLFRGDLLAGFYLQGAPGFERWMGDERRRLRQLASRAAWSLADREQGLPGSTDLAERAAEMAPFDEGSVRRLMEYWVADENQSQAILAYRRFRDRLAEIGLSPGPETQALEAMIRQGDGAAPGTGGGDVAAGPQTPAEAAALAHTLRQRARELLDAAEGFDSIAASPEPHGS